MDIHSLPCRLALELATVEGVPCIIHLTSSIRHRPNACSNRQLHTADGADATLKGVQLRLEGGSAVLAVLRVGALGCGAVHGVGGVSMGTRLDANLRAIPAHATTFYRNGHALGTDHHGVADGELTVFVAAFARANGTSRCVRPWQ